MTQQSSLPWWRSDAYVGEQAIPESLLLHVGPKDLALVKAWPDGRTDQGWGLTGPASDRLNGFMPRYMRGEFNARRVLFGYERDRWAFAIIMRSLNLVCIDIDGKNGGFDHAKKLGALPHTLAEISKSENGYHLFYSTDDPWDPVTGFGVLSDRIGVEQGVDVRASGCVYHHKQQRWNGRAIAPLPDHLRQQLLHRDQKVAAATARIDTIMAEQDELEVLMLHDEILSDLAKPIPSGKRNITLFAIGNQMRQAQITDWEAKLEARAQAVGLGAAETDKLVSNIQQYGSPVQP